MRLEAGQSKQPLFDFDRTFYFFDVHSIPKIRAEQNHYGPAFALELGPDCLLFEEHLLEQEVCQHTAMALLGHLTLDLGVQFSWQAHSHDPDSGQHSEVRQGTEQDLLSLWDA
ncbi:hypothetical protein GCM10008938_36190 [Deinococcus roseus]|uniref:Uncharacterized protein n=1 Tax=Deinococcus roseus TaxID=392414 RepID=A0ABQ2D5G4_9DEIO|nr:hypothetical protein GCM10008938_36190 [Deinococcus roseus]